MGRGGWPALVALVAFATAAALGGCERIVQWQDPGNSEDGGDGGQDGGDGGGADGGDGGSLGDGGTGAWLASFGPGAQFLRAPADGGATYPSALSVSIVRGGESGPVQVNVSSTDAAVASVAGGSVTIPGGALSAVVPLSSSAVGSAILTATFDGGLLQTTVQALPTIVISEVAAATGLTTDDEYVELYNPTPLDFSLTGYALQYHSNNPPPAQYLNICTLGSGKHIAPFSFFLVGVNSSTRTEDAHSTWSGASFSASVGTVRLGAPGIGTGTADNLAIDTVGWGTGAVGPEGSPVDISLLLTWGSFERKAKASSTTSTMNGGVDGAGGNAYDTGDNSNDFVIRSGSQDPQTSLAPPEYPDGG